VDRKKQTEHQAVRTWRQPSDEFIQKYQLSSSELQSVPDAVLLIIHWFEYALPWVLTKEEQSRAEDWSGRPADDLADLYRWTQALDSSQFEELSSLVKIRDHMLVILERYKENHETRQINWRYHTAHVVADALSKDEFPSPSEAPTGAPLWVRRLYALLDELHTWTEGQEGKPALHAERSQRLLSYRLPSHRPQYTFAEMKASMIASADGPRLHHWTDVQDDAAIRHAIDERSPLEVKFRYSALLQWFPDQRQDAQKELSPDQLREKAYGILKNSLREMGLMANMSFHLCMAALLEQAYPEIALDDLITAVGLDPRSTEARVEMRGQMWHWLRVFSCWEIIGRRKGIYKDPDTKKLIDLQATEALFHISGREDPDGETTFALYDSRPPIVVVLARSAWLNKVADNARILAYFGDIRKLAVIPGGKTSGAWARAIGMALNQIWREEATRTEVVAVGEDRKLTARCRPLTRRELLTMFTPTPSVEEVLGGSSPKRVLEYWSGAIAFLKRDIIGYISEPEPPSERKGRYTVWLDQEVDIRPAQEGVADIAVMAKRAATGRKKRGRPHTARPRGDSKLGE